MEPLRLYCRYISLSVRAQMQYRASFFMLTVGLFLLSLLEFCGILILFDRFGQLRGWTLPEIALFYGMVHMAFALAEAAAQHGHTLFEDGKRKILAGETTLTEVLRVTRDEG